MAQLIKLRDYISRYEWNTYRYPSQYMRLKQENWKKLHYLWNNPETVAPDDGTESQETPLPSAFAKLKAFMKKTVGEEEEGPEEESPLPKTEIELKQYFLNKLFPTQLKWATSTVTDVSFMNKGYENDRTLTYFLQRFPDTYLLMYYPIFSLKKAPVDGEIIMISPIGIEIIFLIEESPQATIMAGDERTWTTEKNQVQTKMLSPYIALKRTEQIIKSIFNANEIDFPTKKTILSRQNNIVFHTEPYNIKIIGKHEYDDWFQEKRKLVSPLKNRQLKAVEVLLKNCQTTSVKRPEWEEDSNVFSMDQEVD